MPVPDFQTLMLPVLRLHRDGNEHPLRELNDLLAKEFRLTEDELAESLPSGRASRFANRVGWARTYLTKAGLLNLPSRGMSQLTERGRAVLDSNPPRIDVGFLERFDEFLVFRGSQRDGPAPISEIAQQTALDPYELLEQSYNELRLTVLDDLLTRVKTMHPSKFEQLVVDLLVAMGYGGTRVDAGRAVGRSGDGGIDGTINEDPLGLDIIYIQAKRWQGTVGRPEVQAFAGSLEGQRARKGVFITTSRFSPDAEEYVTRIEKKIVLVDGQRLAALMLEHGIGVTTLYDIAVQRVDQDFFSIEE